MGSALAFSVTKLLSKKVRNDPISSHTLYYTLVSLSLGGVWFLFSPPDLPSLAIWGIIFSAAAIQMAGFVCLVRALESESVVNISPLDYSGLIFSGVFGYLFFQDVITAPVFIGGVIIVLGNLQMIRKGFPIDAAKKGAFFLILELSHFYMFSFHKLNFFCNVVLKND